MGLYTVIGLILTIVGIVIFWYKKKFTYWEDRGFKFVKPEIPFGNVKGLGFSVHFSQLTQKFYNEFKNKALAIGIYIFTQPVLIITNLDVIKHVLVKDFNNFHDRGIYYNEESDPLSAHLFAIEGVEWKNMRAKLSPTFTSGKMKMMFQTVSDICDEMIKHLKVYEKPTEVEMKDILARFTTDVIGNVAFGLDLNSMTNPDSMFRIMGRKVFDPPATQMMKNMFIMNFQNLSKKLKFAVTNKDVSAFFLSSIRETVEYRESKNIKRNDFFNLLLQIKNRGKIDDDIGESIGTLTVNQLAAQSFLFFLAGFETSSTTMTFALYELARNPDVQEKLREHIKSVLTKHNNTLTYEAMLEMKYLQMVIDETLRRFPPVDMLLRKTSNDYKIPNSNLVIPKDMMIFVPVYSIHNDPDIYENPNKFDPERFTEENKLKRHAMAHLPFGEGPRNCVGLRFGLMQTKIGLINLLTHFKFSPSPQTTIPMKFVSSAPLLSPVNDMHLQIEKL